MLFETRPYPCREPSLPDMCGYVHFSSKLAYAMAPILSCPLIQAIAEGRADADLTITKLARSLPPSWAEQEKRLGLD